MLTDADVERFDREGYLVIGNIADAGRAFPRQPLSTASADQMAPFRTRAAN